jgi:hypothetical protein
LQARAGLLFGGVEGGGAKFVCALGAIALVVKFP